MGQTCVRVEVVVVVVVDHVLIQMVVVIYGRCIVF